MKRRISLVIAFALSFLMIFGSIARADETKVQITVTTSESAEIEVVKVPLAEMEKADYPSQVKAKIRVLEEGKQEECKYKAKCGECTTSSGYRGIRKTEEDGSTTCEPCARITCGTTDCTPPGSPQPYGTVWNGQGWNCIPCTL